MEIRPFAHINHKITRFFDFFCFIVTQKYIFSTTNDGREFHDIWQQYLDVSQLKYLDSRLLKIISKSVFVVISIFDILFYRHRFDSPIFVTHFFHFLSVCSVKSRSNDDFISQHYSIELEKISAGNRPCN